MGRVRVSFAAAVAVLGLTLLGGCASHPQPAPLPQLATKTPEIIRDAATGIERTTLSVLIYNVAGLPWPVRTGRGDALREIGAELRRLRREGRAPDLLLLQEAFTPGAARVGIDAGYPNWVPGPGAADRSIVAAPPLDPDFLAGRDFWKGERLGKLLSSGLYLYSEYPITALYKTPFGENSCAGFDCLANKGVMLAEIAIPGVPAPVQILNTHLNARGASGVAPVRSHYAHRRQVDEIRLFLDARLRPDWPFVYGGDFNTRKSATLFDHKVEQIPGTIVRYHCTVLRTDCDVRMSWDGDQPWLDTQDMQGFADGAGVSIRPVRVEAMFDAPRNGRMLSDHDGYLVVYALSWPGSP